jgi:flagellar basal body-associated protein FliL
LNCKHPYVKFFFFRYTTQLMSSPILPNISSTNSRPIQRAHVEPEWSKRGRDIREMRSARGERFDRDERDTQNTRSAQDARSERDARGDVHVEVDGEPSSKKGKSLMSSTTIIVIFGVIIIALVFIILFLLFSKKHTSIPTPFYMRPLPFGGGIPPPSEPTEMKASTHESAKVEEAREFMRQVKGSDSKSEKADTRMSFDESDELELDTEHPAGHESPESSAARLVREQQEN